MKMKLNQSKLKLLLLGVLSVSALNVFADNKIITSSTIETGASYNDSDPNLAALNVTTNGVTYSGTNITLSATSNDYSFTDGALFNPNGKGAYIINGAILSLTDSYITTSGSWGFGVGLFGSSGTLNNLVFQSTGERGYGAFASNNSTLTMNGGSVTTNNAGSRGVRLQYGSSATLNGVDITTYGGSQSAGVYMMINSTLNLTGGSIRTFNGSGVGIHISQTSSADLYNVNIQTEGDSNSYAINVATSSTLTLDGGIISTNGLAGHGIQVTGSSTANISNVNVQTQGAQSYGVGMGGSVTLTDSDIHTSGSGSWGVYVSSTNSGTVSNVNIQTEGAAAHGAYVANSSTLTMTDSDISATGNNADAINVASRSTATVNLNHHTITGNILAGGTSTLTITGSNSASLTGNVTGTTGGTIGITLTDAGTELHGNFRQTGAATAINLTVGAGALFHGSGELDSLTLESGAIIGYADDVLLVTDSITIGDNITIDFGNLTETGDYLVFDWSNASGGDSINASQFSVTDPGIEGSFSVDNNQLTFNATAVPEPSTWFLIGAGLGALALIRRRSS
ncbi:MAG: PEP-CTERM sorting domain-containing protein [Verrucomicrobiales bacterium]|nr:PEP-CTERM sorting domain-containing protein [Verrucomicrobiales bacterium]